MNCNCTNFGRCNCNSISKQSKLQDVQTQANKYHKRTVYALVCSLWRWPWHWGRFDNISQLGIQICKYDISIRQHVQIQPSWQTSWLRDKHLAKKNKKQKWHLDALRWNEVFRVFFGGVCSRRKHTVSQKAGAYQNGSIIEASMSYSWCPVCFLLLQSFLRLFTHTHTHTDDIFLCRVGIVGVRVLHHIGLRSNSLVKHGA